MKLMKLVMTTNDGNKLIDYITAKDDEEETIIETQDELSDKTQDHVNSLISYSSLCLKDEIVEAISICDATDTEFLRF